MPVADVAAVKEDASVTGTVASNDTDPDGDAMTYSIAAPVAGLTFIPQTGKPSIHSLLDQKGNLISLADRVNQANSGDAVLSLLARDFAQLASARLPQKEATSAYLVPLYVSQMSRYTNSLLAGESYNPEWVPQLVASIDRFNKLVGAFVSGGQGVSAITDPEMARLLARLPWNRVEPPSAAGTA